MPSGRRSNPPSGSSATFRRPEWDAKNTRDHFSRGVLTEVFTAIPPTIRVQPGIVDSCGSAQPYVLRFTPIGYLRATRDAPEARGQKEGYPHFSGIKPLCACKSGITRRRKRVGRGLAMWRPGIRSRCMFETPKTRVIKCFSLFSRHLRRFMPSICSMWWILCITVTWAKKPWHWWRLGAGIGRKWGFFEPWRCSYGIFCLQPQGRTRFPQDLSSRHLAGHHRCARVPPELGIHKISFV